MVQFMFQFSETIIRSFIEVRIILGGTLSKKFIQMSIYSGASKRAQLLEKNLQCLQNNVSK